MALHGRKKIDGINEAFTQMFAEEQRGYEAPDIDYRVSTDTLVSIRDSLRKIQPSTGKMFTEAYYNTHSLDALQNIVDDIWYKSGRTDSLFDKLKQAMYEECGSGDFATKQHGRAWLDNLAVQFDAVANDYIKTRM